MHSELFLESNTVSGSTHLLQGLLNPTFGYNEKGCAWVQASVFTLYRFRMYVASSYSNKENTSPEDFITKS